MLGEDGRFMSHLDDDMAIIIMLTGRLRKHYGITTIGSEDGRSKSIYAMIAW
jgi:hypothetical protein